MTALTSFYLPVRALLGDRLVHGMWNYDDTTLQSALLTVFATGKGPVGYALDTTDLTTAEAVVPDVTFGDPFALTCCEAALLLVGGEDGGMQIRTRAMLVRDEGDRKRDLLWRLTQECYRIRDGEQVFVTMQSFAAFLGVMRNNGGEFPWEEFTQLNVTNPLSSLTI